jgi:Bacterial Ig-like domain (group 1)
MTKKSTPLAPMGGVGKWLTAIITTGAALAALLVNARNLGMNEWLGLADYSARRVWITPRIDTLWAIGDTAALAANVTDKRGAALSGVGLVWRSMDTTVVVVDSAGTVIARGPGAAKVTVAVRDIVGQAMVIVRQRPAGISIPGDTVVRLLEGDTVPFVAHALDARGQAISELVPHWHSADSAVVAVDSMGRGFALAPGWTTLTAATAGFDARISVRVDLAPASIAPVAGGFQRVPAGRKLPQPIAVRVLSRGGTPVPGATVAFTPADGEGGVTPATAIADREGRARTTWTLSPRPGRQYLVTSVAMLDSALTIEAEADPLPGNTKVELAAAPLAGVVGEAIGAPVVVRATDSTGAAVADVPIAWRVVDGGTVEAEAPRTDSLGEARAHWTLGPHAGRQRLRVQVGNPRTMPPVSITATATAAAPARLVVLGGQRQIGTVGTRLAKALTVGVRDGLGNAVPGVQLRVRALQGSVPDSAPLSDSAGRATLLWTLGRHAGPSVLQVRAARVDSLVTITARARPGAAANVTFQNPPAKATAGTRTRIAAVVADAYGNPVSDALVVFTASGGAFSASRVMTDTTGQAMTRWTPGASPTDQRLTVTLRGTTIKATHTVRVSAPSKKR